MENLCKKCGKVIIPGRTSSGKDVNFDAGMPIYLKTGVDENGLVADLEPDAFVDHDFICPNKDANFTETFMDGGPR